MPGNTKVIIRNAEKIDVNSIVRIHQECFRGFLMTLLGPFFLKQYYSLVLSFSKHIALVASDKSNEVLGFVVGFLDPQQFYMYFRKNKFTLAVNAFLYAIWQPQLWIRIYRSWQKSANLSSDGLSGESYAELASLAVSSHCSGKGVGKSLVIAFLEEARRRGISQVTLTTDAENNEKVNNFYTNLGFDLKSQVQYYGNLHRNVYIFSMQKLANIHVEI